MLDMGVWRHVKRNDYPNDCRLVGCRWVFKVNRNCVCCTPCAINAKPRTMEVKRARRDCWMGRLGKVPMHAHHVLHMYVCASAPAPRPSQKPLCDTSCVPKNTPFSLF